MPKEETLKRVEEDIAAGRLGHARIRLVSLIDTYPEDLDLRSRLAEVYLRLDNRREAGRWWYLVPNPTSKQLACIQTFEASCGKQPSIILELLRWPMEQDHLLDASVRDRLASFRAYVHDPYGKKNPLNPEARPLRRDPWMITCFVLVLIGAILALIGLSTVFGWVRRG